MRRHQNHKTQQATKATIIATACDNIKLGRARMEDQVQTVDSIFSSSVGGRDGNGNDNNDDCNCRMDGTTVKASNARRLTVSFITGGNCIFFPLHKSCLPLLFLFTLQISSASKMDAAAPKNDGGAPLPLNVWENRERFLHVMATLFHAIH